MAIILFLICLLASTVGAVVGAGGGVIIKPVLDMAGLMPVAISSFYSGSTVLCMSICSLLISRKDGIRLHYHTSTPLAFGAVIGGLAGKWLFEFAKSRLDNDDALRTIQAVFLAIVTVLVLLYIVNKRKIASLHVKSVSASCLIGCVLGTISSFLGIGGGPTNVAVLFFFFSMNAKEAAKNSLYIIIFSQTASLVTSIASHTVPDLDWINLLSMVLGGVGGGLIGKMISRRIDHKGVEKMLIALMGVIILISCYNIVK